MKINKKMIVALMGLAMGIGTGAAFASSAAFPSNCRGICQFQFETCRATATRDTIGDCYEARYECLAQCWY